MIVRSYRDLDVWKKAVALVLDVYEVTKLFPKDELYALTNQIRRAAVSIPSNIAEGRSKRSTKDFLRYLSISYGSVAELETQIIISDKLGYLATERAAPLLDQLARIGRMLNGMISGLEDKMKGTPRMPNAECRMPEEHHA